MEIKKEYPPNWQTVKILNPRKTSVFCFGEHIYNPSGGEIPEDVIFHESVHSERQGTTPSAWWKKYVSNTKFRLNEDRLAFGAQYAFIKRHYPSKAHKEALTEMAFALTDDYSLDITYLQAENLIRKTGDKLLDEQKV